MSDEGQQFLFASAVDADARALVQHCLTQLGAIAAPYNLGFVYASDRLADDMPLVLARLQQAAPAVHWVGTVGLGICSSGQEVYERPALAIMLGAFPSEAFRIIPGLLDSPGALPPDLRDWCQAQDYGFALLHGDPSNPDTPALLQRLLREQGALFINGGLSSSNGDSNPQLADAVVEGGLSGVLFNHQVEVLTDHTQGCSPIGPAHEITKAQNNIAITLDHQPALAVMKAEIGEVLAKDLAKIGGYIFVALPIPGSDSGDYLVRNLVGIDPEQGLVAVGDRLDDQQRLMYCRRDGNTAREDLQRMLQRLRKRGQGRPIRGGVYVSCLGRGRYQFGDNSEELKLIQQELGDFPLVGFFANGEIYNGRLYGYTGVLTLFL
jgi:small ligand-binding sensory domain FIST